MKKYQPDLDEFISQCEVNYYLIIQLIPLLNVKQNQALTRQANVAVWGATIGVQKIEFCLTEKAKYTSSLLLKIETGNVGVAQDLELLLRLYHDLQLVEVMDMSGPKAMQAVFTGLRLNNRQTDEKRQVNRFLGESLKYCLAGQLVGS